MFSDPHQTHGGEFKKIAPGIRFPLAPFIVRGRVPSCFLPLPCVPAAPEALSPLPGSSPRFEFAAEGVVGWGLLKRSAGNLGKQQSVPRSSCPPGRRSGVFRAGTRKDKATAGAGWPREEAAGGGGQRRARAGAQPGNRSSQGKPRGKAASGSPLPSRNPSRAFPPAPRRRDWSRGSLLSPSSGNNSRILKFSSELVRRGKPSVAGALQGSVKSGNAPIYAYIFIQSGSVLLQD